MKKILCTLFFVALAVLLCGCSGKTIRTEQIRDPNEVSFALYTEPPNPEQRQASGKTTRGGDITLSVKINWIGIREEYIPHHVIVEITPQTGNYTFDRTFAEAYAESGGIDELTFTLSQVAAENFEKASFDVSVSTFCVDGTPTVDLQRSITIYSCATDRGDYYSHYGYSSCLKSYGKEKYDQGLFTAKEYIEFRKEKNLGAPGNSVVQQARYEENYESIKIRYGLTEEEYQQVISEPSVYLPIYLPEIYERFLERWEEDRRGLIETYTEEVFKEEYEEWLYSQRDHVLSNNDSYFSREDYKILHSEDEDSTAGMPPSAQTHSSPALQYVQTRPFCINGRVYYLDKAGNLHPAKNVYCYIELLEDGERRIWTTAYTDEDGGYSFSGGLSINSGCEYSARVKVLSKSSYNISVIDIEQDEFEITAETEPQRIYDMSSTSTVYFTLNIDDMYLYEDNDKISIESHALNVLQAANYAAEYAEAAYDFSVGFLPVYLEEELGNAYYTKDEGIHIDPEYSSAWDVIHHEFGHFVDRYSNISDPDVGGNHYMGLSTLHEHSKIHGCKLAWSEGFATYFAIAAQTNSFGQDSPYYQDKRCYGRYGGSEYLFGDTVYDGRRDVAVENTYHIGETYEGDVLIFLYRLQNIVGGESTVISYLKNSRCVNLSEFVQYLYSRCSTSQKMAINSLLTDIHCTANTSYGTLTGYTNEEAEPYVRHERVIQWTVGNGETPLPNNKFEIIFYADKNMQRELFRSSSPTMAEGERFADEYGEFLYEVDFRITVGEDNKTRTFKNGTVTYTLFPTDIEQWFAFVRSNNLCGNTLYWAVKEYNVYDVYIYADVTTGGYISHTGEIEFPEVNLKKPEIACCWCSYYDYESETCVLHFLEYICGADADVVYLMRADEYYDSYEIISSVDLTSSSSYRCAVFSDYNLEPCREYFYKVISYSKLSGTYSQTSDIEIIHTDNPPINITGRVENGTAIFTWNDFGGNITYEVYRVVYTESNPKGDLVYMYTTDEPVFTTSEKGDFCIVFKSPWVRNGARIAYFNDSDIDIGKSMPLEDYCGNINCHHYDY